MLDRFASLLLPCALALPFSELGSVAPTALDPELRWESPSGPGGTLKPGELSLPKLSELGAAFLRVEHSAVDGGAARLGEPDASSAARAVIRFLDGESLVAGVVGGSGDALRVEIAPGVQLDVLVDRLRSLRFAGRVEAALEAQLEAPESGDLLHWVRPGGSVDRVAGTLLEFTAEGPRMEGAFGERVIAWPEVAALFIEPLGAPEPPAPVDSEVDSLQQDAPVVVELVGGGRLRGKLRGLSADALQLQLSGFGGSGTEPIELAMVRIAEVALDSGAVRFLSDLAVLEAPPSSPFDDDLGLVWPLRIDAAVGGKVLRAGGRTWLRGLGVHAPSRVVYGLDGSWSQLRGSVAIDDQTQTLAGRGSVRFRVTLDGRELWSSEIVRGGDGVQPMPLLDVSGGQQLVLEVDTADEMFVADRADWLRLVLVR